MRYHFIAIGGAVMHQLALHLCQEGHDITGSDDAIYEPAKGNLAKAGILPPTVGWDEHRITSTLDAIVLGMHAKQDNVELQKALQLGIPVYSFPEFIYQQSKDKQRIVVAGSHGKTTITSMILHMLLSAQQSFDYLVGAQLEGFQYMVKTSSDAPCIVIEGDEYLTSPLDLRSKFLHYHPHIAIISGIAWDHINVFPTFESYLDTFRSFIKSIDVNGYLIYNEEDAVLKKMVKELNPSCTVIPYRAFNYHIAQEQIYIDKEDTAYPIQVFGKHNLSNLSAAFEVGKILGVAEDAILSSFFSFKGAAKRLEKVLESEEDKITIYRDFAHAPSKVKATVAAVRERYSHRNLIAVFELNTYSSLQEDFVVQYAHSLEGATRACVYLDSEALKIKGKEGFDKEWIQAQFDYPGLSVCKTKEDLYTWIQKGLSPNTVLLLMSSGNLGGLQVPELSL